MAYVDDLYPLEVGGAHAVITLHIYYTYNMYLGVFFPVVWGMLRIALIIVRVC